MFSETGRLALSFFLLSLVTTAYSSTPFKSTDPLMFTKIFEVAPSLKGIRQTLQNNYQEIDSDSIIIVQFDENSMELPETVEVEESPSIVTPAVEVIVEIFGILNGLPIQLAIQPFKPVEPPIGSVDSASDGEADSTTAAVSSTAANEATRQNSEVVSQLNNPTQFQATTSEALIQQQTEIDALRRSLISTKDPMPYNPSQPSNRVIPDQYIDLSVVGTDKYERIKIRVTNIRTNEAYEVNVTPKPFGYRIKVGASLMFLNRVGVGPDTDVNEIDITDVNFSAAPGVTISGTFYDRNQGFLSPIVRFLHPGIGFNASYLSWNDGNTATDIEIGLGLQASLFNDTIYGTYGWNLQAPAYNAYFGVGVNFVNLFELFSQ